MTIEQVRNHEEYAKAMEKIKTYRSGFKFTLDYSRIPTPQGNALKIVMRDAIKEGLLESVAIGLAIDGSFVDETFKKL